ncbi:MAG: (Fe-S)-binding protein [Planctomycetes bacterium]|nr:(Fe-S)-binding protein [Planctomycetota bacterium]
METVAPFAQVVAEIREARGEAYRFCYQCGKCDVVCPWNRVRNFSIRKIMWQASLGLPEIELEDIWRCTTCGSCPSHCPRGVDQIGVGTAIRRVATSYEVFPGSVRPVRAAATSLLAHGNPLSEERGKRAAWANGLPVKPFAEGMELLYFVGCYNSYDPRLQKVAAATARILDKAGVTFGILGTRESCCGESIRKTGNEDVFKTLARENIKAFIDNGVKRILVSSPHCYHTFRNEYPEFMVKFEVVHVAQFLAELIEQGRLRLSGRYPKKVTYHDPCYLGRHNGIYDQPRDVLRRLPGLELVEMQDSRQRSLCCGGGGGRIWMETPKSERFSDLRVAQARATGAEVLATACPYCITNFEESSLALPGGEPLLIKDVTEIVQEALLGQEEAR